MHQRILSFMTQSFFLACEFSRIQLKTCKNRIIVFISQRCSVIQASDLFRVKRLEYSYVSNKRRRSTFILFEEIFQALLSYSRPYVYLFLKKSLKIWVKIEKSGYFQQFLCLIFKKIQALR